VAATAEVAEETEEEAGNSNYSNKTTLQETAGLFCFVFVGITLANAAAFARVISFNVSSASLISTPQKPEIAVYAPYYAHA
jgi:hypothetical protein